MKSLNIDNITRLNKVRMNCGILDDIFSGLKSFPIDQATHCTHIFLSMNYIREIPPEVHRFTYIRALYLNNNQIIEIPTSLCNLVKLEEIQLSRNFVRL